MIDPNNALQEHMEAQPYSIVCGKCGKDLSGNISVTVDSDFDLQMVVEPCECTEQETPCPQ